MPAYPKPGRHLLLIVALLACLLPAPGIALTDADSNPLQPADTSSPRATLQVFIQTLDNINTQILAVIKSYMASSRLYVSRQESQEIERTGQKLDLVIRTLDLSEIPVALIGQLADPSSSLYFHTLFIFYNKSPTCRIDF